MILHPFILKWDENRKTIKIDFTFLYFFNAKVGFRNMCVGTNSYEKQENDIIECSSRNYYHDCKIIKKYKIYSSSVPF
jgi:hypothetical protein